MSSALPLLKIFFVSPRPFQRPHCEFVSTCGAGVCVWSKTKSASSPTRERERERKTVVERKQRDALFTQFPNAIELHDSALHCEAVMRKLTEKHLFLTDKSSDSPGTKTNCATAVNMT